MSTALIVRNCLKTMGYRRASWRFAEPKRSKAATRREFSTENAEDLPRVHIPKPTWSLKDLELSKDVEPVSMEELNRLARKSLLDIRKLPDPDLMRHELASMLHCLEQLKKVDLPVLNDNQIYDDPRGVASAPLRKKLDPLRPEEEIEAKNVSKNMLKSKMIERNGSFYFSVVTKRHKISKKG